MPLTAAEQYLLELINRARLDPLAEAARHGIALNEGLSPGTIDATAKQVLAPNEFLHQAASDHSLWMLATDTFSHTGQGGSSAGQRMADAGYDFTGNWTWGENLSWRGTTGTLDPEAAIELQHQGLFLSPGHRENLMFEGFREIGVAQEIGRFTTTKATYNASMVTENFAKSGNDVFVTGVVYDDLDGDDFYSIGEGHGGAVFSLGAQTVATEAAGGYALKMAPTPSAVVGITYGDFDGTVSIDVSGGNAKLDYVVGGPVLLSADATLVSGIAHARLLGVDDLSLTGDGGANRLEGNAGDNVLSGGGGDDTLEGGAGADTLDGGEGSDLYLADALDFIFDSGTEGFDLLRTFDGIDPDLDLASLGIEAVVSDGDDVIDASGVSMAVVIDGAGGNDQVIGGSGDDILVGGGVGGSAALAESLGLWRYAGAGEDFMSTDAFFLV